MSFEFAPHTQKKHHIVFVHALRLIRTCDITMHDLQIAVLSLGVFCVNFMMFVKSFVTQEYS